MIQDLITLSTSAFKSVITFLTWRDLLEISALSTFFYHSALWLKKDRDKNLLPIFYGYLLLLVGTHLLQLSTLSSLLFICSPVIATLFIVMHQQTLQRNLISLKNIILPQEKPSDDWLSCIMRGTLSMLTHKKNMLILIEHTDALSPYLQIGNSLNVPLTDGLISLLLHRLYDPHQMCWITSSGILRGIDATFKASWHPTSYQTKNDWVDDAIAYTTKTDAVMLFVDGEHHLYSIALDGAITENLSMEQARQLITKQIPYSTPPSQKGYRHGVTQQKNFAHRSP